VIDVRRPSVYSGILRCGDDLHQLGRMAEVLWPVHRDTPSLFVPPSAIATTTGGAGWGAEYYFETEGLGSC
jgi:hypothetical protein